MADPRLAAAGAMARGGVALLAAGLVASAAQAGQDCAGLTRHFDFCDAGTEWAGATWAQYGDGADIVLEGWRFGFAEDWAGRHGNEAPDAAAALEALMARSAEDFVQTEHLRDGFAAGALRVERSLRTMDFDDGPLRRATMIAEGPDGHRIMLMLDAPSDTPLDRLDRRSRDLVALVRPTGE